MKNYVEHYAKINGLEIEGFLGSGDFGEAYLTTKNTVIKITSDEAEFVLAHSIEGKKMDNTVEVFHTSMFDNGLMIIHQEFLNTHGVEDLFSELNLEADAQGVCLLDIDTEEESMVYGLSDEAICLLNDISYSVYEYQKNGFNPNDIHDRNIGIKDNGNYALFDQRDEISNIKDYIEKYKQINKCISIDLKNQKNKKRATI